MTQYLVLRVGRVGECCSYRLPVAVERAHQVAALIALAATPGITGLVIPLEPSFFLGMRGTWTIPVLHQDGSIAIWSIGTDGHTAQLARSVPQPDLAPSLN